MSSPVARFSPSRRYLVMGIAALGGTALSVWSALRWNPAGVDSSGLSEYLPETLRGPWLSPAWLGSLHSAWSSLAWFNLSWIAAVLFAIPAAALLYLASRPAIEIYETHLRIGRREIRWNSIRRLDQSRWTVPLLVFLTLEDKSRLWLIHPGDSDSAASLLRYLRRSARQALLDGVPYPEFWGEQPAAPPPTTPPPTRYPLLRREDEEEVERLFQRLKSVGHLERKDADEE